MAGRGFRGAWRGGDVHGEQHDRQRTGHQDDGGDHVPCGSRHHESRGGGTSRRSCDACTVHMSSSLSTISVRAGPRHSIAHVWGGSRAPRPRLRCGNMTRCGMGGPSEATFLKQTRIYPEKLTRPAVMAGLLGAYRGFRMTHGDERRLRHTQRAVRRLVARGANCWSRWAAAPAKAATGG